MYLMINESINEGITNHSRQSSLKYYILRSIALCSAKHLLHRHITETTPYRPWCACVGAFEPSGSKTVVWRRRRMRWLAGWLAAPVSDWKAFLQSRLTRSGKCWHSNAGARYQPGERGGNPLTQLKGASARRQVAGLFRN